MTSEELKATADFLLKNHGDYNYVEGNSTYSQDVRTVCEGVVTLIKHAAEMSDEITITQNVIDDANRVRDNHVTPAKRLEIITNQREEIRRLTARAEAAEAKLAELRSDGRFEAETGERT